MSLIWIILKVFIAILLAIIASAVWKLLGFAFIICFFVIYIAIEDFFRYKF